MTRPGPRRVGLLSRRSLAKRRMSPQPREPRSPYASLSLISWAPEFRRSLSSKPGPSMTAPGRSRLPVFRDAAEQTEQDAPTRGQPTRIPPAQKRKAARRRPCVSVGPRRLTSGGREPWRRGEMRRSPGQQNQAPSSPRSTAQAHSIPCRTRTSFAMSWL